MESDFINGYRRYSEAELMAIIGAPGAHSQAAIDAAKAALGSRHPDRGRVLDGEDALLSDIHPARLPDGVARSIFDEEDAGYDPVQLRQLRLVLVVAIIYFVAFPVYGLLYFSWLALQEGEFVSRAFLIISLLGIAAYTASAILVWKRRSLGWKVIMVLTSRMLVLGAVQVFVWAFMDGQEVSWLSFLNLGVAALVVYLLRSPGIRDEAAITRPVMWGCVIIGSALYLAEWAYTMIVFGTGLG